MSHGTGTASAPNAFALEVLRRLPLAEAFHTVRGYVAADPVLGDLFVRHRGRCYEDRLTFAELVRVLADAPTRYRGRGRGAVLDAVERNRISCQARAVYGKLSRLPLAARRGLSHRPHPATAAALPRHCPPARVAREPGRPVGGRGRREEGRTGGRRLLPTGNRPGKPSGGERLVAYLRAEGVAVALAADADGEANDIRSVPALLPTVRGVVTGPRLWAADRQFCDPTQPRRFADGGDHFAVRYGRNTGFHADPNRAPTDGAADGRAIRQEWGWLGAEGQGERRLDVRRVTLVRPGDVDVAVVTDLLDERAYPAADLLAVYLTRWQIESVFQQITEVFCVLPAAADRLPPSGDGVPGVAVPGAVKRAAAGAGYTAAGRPEPVVEDVSAEQVFADLTRDLVGLHDVLSVEEVVGGVSVPGGDGPMRDRLRACWAGCGRRSGRRCGPRSRSR